MNSPLEKRILREVGLSMPDGILQADLVARLSGSIDRPALARAIHGLEAEGQIVDDGHRLLLGALPLDPYALAQHVAQLHLVAEREQQPQARAAAAWSMMPSALVALVAQQAAILRRLDRLVEIAEGRDD